MRRKIALFCNVSADAVIQSVDVDSIYKVPVKMHEQHLDDIVLHKTGTTPEGEPHMKPWLDFLEKMDKATETVTIGLVGKYVELQDAYKSSTKLCFRQRLTPITRSRSNISIPRNSTRATSTTS